MWEQCHPSKTHFPPHQEAVADVQVIVAVQVEPQRAPRTQVGLGLGVDCDIQGLPRAPMCDLEVAAAVQQVDRAVPGYSDRLCGKQGWEVSSWACLTGAQQPDVTSVWVPESQWGYLSTDARWESGSPMWHSTTAGSDGAADPQWVTSYYQFKLPQRFDMQIGTQNNII